MAAPAVGHFSDNSSAASNVAADHMDTDGRTMWIGNFVGSQKKGVAFLFGAACVRVCMCARACVCACVCMCARAWMCACMCACVCNTRTSTTCVSDLLPDRTKKIVRETKWEKVGVVIDFFLSLLNEIVTEIPEEDS